MPNIELIYCSTIAPETALSAVFDIQSTAQVANPQAGITGMLVFSSRFFLQVIEGPRATLHNLYLKIGQDARHRNVSLLASNVIAGRTWANWSMGMISKTDANEPIFSRYFQAEEFDPYRLDAFTARALLLDLTLLTYGNRALVPPAPALDVGEL